MCDVTVCSSCACCVVGQNPSQTSAWCPMVTAQLANMTGDTYFLLVIFLKFYNTIIRTNKTVQLHKIQTTNDRYLCCGQAVVVCC